MFTLLYCLWNLSCGECNVISLYCLCYSVNGTVCLVCCVFDSVCKLFGETICNILETQHVHAAWPHKTQLTCFDALFVTSLHLG